MAELVSFNENMLPENNEVHGIAAAETHDAIPSAALATEYPEQIDASGESTTLPDDSSPLATDRPRKRRDVAHGIRDAVLRPLLVVFTTQSVIVAVLVCLVAVAPAQHASQIISEKFAAINAALRRF